MPAARTPVLALNDSRWWVEVSAAGIIVLDKQSGNAPYAAALWRAGAAQLLARLRLGSANGARQQASRLNSQLGIGPKYGSQRALVLQNEPNSLIHCGIDRYRRSVWLHHSAAIAWRKMRSAAAYAGLTLEVISAFRSIQYQAMLIRRKRARGESIESILSVSAAPGYSEHHSGLALDLAEPGAPALTEEFAETQTFAWLQKNAQRFGFVMSFPPENRHGVLFEPWHWCYRPSDTGSSAIRLRAKKDHNDE